MVISTIIYSEKKVLLPISGVVTTAYWATSAEDAELWLRPLCKLGISNLSISDDAFHIDSYGHIRLCQGLIMSNIWETPLPKLVKNYDTDSHPIYGPLLKGGPAFLAKKYAVKHDEKYVSACHFCYNVRLSLLDRFPKYLAPRQVYGVE